MNKDPFAASPDRLVGVLHDVYDRLRDAAPTHWSPALGGWVLTRYADVRIALTDERLTADRTRSWLADLDSTDGAFDLLAATRRDMLMFSDGPQHARLRRVLMPMMRSRSEVLHCSVLKHVEVLLDAVGDAGKIDLVDALAGPLPMRVLTSALGIPEQEGSRLAGWARVFNAALASPPTPLAAAAGQRAVTELGVWLADVAVDDGIVDGLRRLVAAGTLTHSEVLATVLSLVSAGHGTVTDLITSSLDALGQAPAQRSWLTANVGTISLALDELLRFVSPVQLTRREACAPIRLAGAPIERGERVIAAIGAANRDPDVFDMPHRLDLRRKNAHRQVAFGFGAHRCPGVVPARLQAEIAVGAFLRRFPSFELAEPAVWRPNLTLRGPQRLVVALQGC